MNSETIGASVHRHQRFVAHTPFRSKLTAKLIWVARFDFLRDITPFDVRCMLSMIVLATVWKLLSLDFGALSNLCSRPPLVSFNPLGLYYALAGIQCGLFSIVSPSALQLATAAALIGFVAKPTRFILIPAIAGLWLIDTSAALYRWNFYDLDTPTAILMLVAVVPVSLRKAAGISRERSATARIVATAALA